MFSFSKRLFTSLLLSFIFFSSIAQDIHTPAEIFKIMEESKLTYAIEILEEEVEAPDRSNNLNFNDYYRVTEGNQIISYQYDISEEGQKNYLAAEEYFQKGYYKKAREKYQEVLKTDPGYFKVMTYIGQTYRLEDDNKTAIEWFKKTIDKNYIDYMAHWFLATTYLEEGKKKDAVREIITAKILNRNNPRIHKTYKEVFKKAKLNEDNWEFVPQIIIDSISPKEVRVAAGENWMGYGLAKAVWAFEPGYRESMGGGSSSTLEEREAFVGLAAIFDKKVLKKNPELKALSDAIDGKMIDEYILYEVILPQYPFVAYQLPEPFIKEMVEYVLKVRGKS